MMEVILLADCYPGAYRNANIFCIEVYHI